MFVVFTKSLNIYTYGNIAKIKFWLRKYFGVNDFKKILDEILAYNQKSSKPVDLFPHRELDKNNTLGVEVPDTITDKLLDDVINARPDIFNK